MAGGNGFQFACRTDWRVRRGGLIGNVGRLGIASGERQIAAVHLTDGSKPFEDRAGLGKSEPLIHKVDERLSDAIAMQVFAEQIGHVINATRTLAADVGRDDDIRDVPEGAGR
jgi:hypothetical protein